MGRVRAWPSRGIGRDAARCSVSKQRPARVAFVRGRRVGRTLGIRAQARSDVRGGPSRCGRASKRTRVDVECACCCTRLRRHLRVVKCVMLEARRLCSRHCSGRGAVLCVIQRPARVAWQCSARRLHGVGEGRAWVARWRACVSHGARLLAHPVASTGVALRVEAAGGATGWIVARNRSLNRTTGSSSSIASTACGSSTCASDSRCLRRRPESTPRWFIGVRASSAGVPLAPRDSSPCRMSPGGVVSTACCSSSAAANSPV